jgi:hypothetical protein
VCEMAAGLGRDDAEDVGRAEPDVLVVSLRDSPRSHRPPRSLGGVQLDRSLVEGDDRFASLAGFSIRFSTSSIRSTYSRFGLDPIS